MSDEEDVFRHPWNREVAEKLGEMHTVWSDQYRCSCVVVYPSDKAIDIIEHCRIMGAIYHEDGPDDECFCVVLRFNVGPEIYTEAALRGSRP